MVVGLGTTPDELLYFTGHSGENVELGSARKRRKYALHRSYGEPVRSLAQIHFLLGPIRVKMT